MLTKGRTTCSDVQSASGTTCDEASPLQSDEPADPMLMDRIRSHPLFPILEQIVLKCDRAINSFDSEAFEMKGIYENLQKIGMPQLVTTEDVELDEFMKESVKENFYQLAQLRKVYNFAEMFMARYQHTLKKRVSHEALIGASGDSDDELTMSPTTTPTAITPPATIASSSRNKSMDIPNGPSFVPTSGPSTSSIPPGPIAVLTTPSGTISIPLHIPNFINTTTTPTSPIITANSLPKHMTAHMMPPTTSTSSNEGMNKVYAWLYRSLFNPDPDSEEKRALAEEAGVAVERLDATLAEMRQRMLHSQLAFSPAIPSPFSTFSSPAFFNPVFSTAGMTRAAFPSPSFPWIPFSVPDEPKNFEPK